MRIALFVVLALALLPARADVGEGLWEIQITTSVPGIKAAAPMSAKQTHCLNAADARDPGVLMGKPAAGCEFANRRDNGVSYRFDVVCKGPSADVSGNGEMRYTRDSLEGDIVLGMGAPGARIETRSSIQARRLGPCR